MNKISDERSMASSVIQHQSMPQAVWNLWTTRRAVKEGYSVSGWVFKAISLITKPTAAVPWHVETIEGEIISAHPLTKVFQFPNPEFSRQDFFELLISWQQLSGVAYAKKVISAGRVTELWPISPDRITPIPGKDSELVSGYKIITDEGKEVKSSEFTTENVIPFKFLDPADPTMGIGPLQVAARAVDTDVEQVKWNKSAMQNRGVLDGLITFDKDINKSLYTVIKQSIREMMQGQKNARDIGVIGSNAKYQRLSLTPVEMDFITSRKFNREEIFTIFGVPPQLAGSQEAMTFNNFNTALRIFWEMTLIPILDDLKDTFNHSLRSQLGEGLRIGYNISNVPALKQDQKMAAETSKIFFDMGVPVSILNERFTLGISEYEGWERSFVKTAPVDNVNVPDEERKEFSLKTIEHRNIEDEIARKETIAERNTGMFKAALKVQQDAVFNALEENTDLRGALDSASKELQFAVNKMYQKTAESFAGTVLVDQRGGNVDFEVRVIAPALALAISQLIANEALILTELSLLNSATATAVIGAAVDGEREGKTVNEIQQAILDSGTFSSERALTISRTISGTAQSVGQIEGARSAGATSKTWHDSGFEVRQEHRNRNGETVDINARFSSQFFGFPAPRWPLDQNIAAGDRINCRCSMSFSID